MDIKKPRAQRPVFVAPRPSCPMLLPRPHPPWICSLSSCGLWDKGPREKRWGQTGPHAGAPCRWAPGSQVQGRRPPEDGPPLGSAGTRWTVSPWRAGTLSVSRFAHWSSCLGLEPALKAEFHFCYVASSPPLLFLSPPLRLHKQAGHSDYCRSRPWQSTDQESP